MKRRALLYLKEFTYRFLRKPFILLKSLTFKVVESQKYKLSHFSNNEIDLRSRNSRSTRLQIGYVLWNFPTISETFVVNELRWLVSNGFDVRLYFHKPSARFSTLDFNIESVQFDSNEELADLLVRDDRNLIHSHFVYPTVTNIVWPVSEKTQIPFTFIAHAVDIFHYRNEARNNIDKVSQSKYCLKVFAPGRFHKNYFVTHGVPENKIALIPQTIDCGFYDFESQLIKKTQKSKSIFTIGRFVEKKGFEYLIKAAAEFPHLEFNIYGFGDLEEKYIVLIRKLELKNVIIRGPIEGRDQLKNVMLSHDLFICPCLRASNGDMDGIPTVLMEAMASGVPVISTNISSIPDLIQDGINGFLAKPASVESLAEKINQFLKLSEEKRTILVKEAKETVKFKFDISRTMDKIIRIWSHKEIDVFMVTYNNPKVLKEIIRRLYKYTDTPFRLIIIDNNSNSRTKKMISRFQAMNSNVVAHLLSENIYCGPASNIALKSISSEYGIYICSKEGFVLQHGWETSMIDYMSHNQRVGLASQLIHHPAYPSGISLKKLPLFHKFRNLEYAEKVGLNSMRHVQGGFFIIRKKMFDEIGGFSQDVFHNNMDIEYSYYIESRGWKIGEIPGLFSLSIKTLPNLDSILDEKTFAAHPLDLKKAKKVDLVINKGFKKCNICGWIGKTWLNDQICIRCKATSVERLFFRHLATSDLIYTNLKCLGLNIGNSLTSHLRKMFSYDQSDSGTNNYDLILVNLSFDSCKSFDDCIHRIVGLFKILKENGSLILHLDYDKYGLKNEDVDFALSELGFKVEKKLYTSLATNYTNLYIFNCLKTKTK